jgi:CRP/FNR family cyclic AMP-dependent transcriptional regulator
VRDHAGARHVALGLPLSRSPCHDCASRRLCILGKLPEATREHDPSLVQERAFRKGEMVQRQGLVADRLCVVKIGLTLARREGDDGQSRVVALFGRGQTSGAFALLGRPEALASEGALAGRVCEVDLARLRSLGLLDTRFLCDLAELQIQSFGRLADWSQMARLSSTRDRLLTALRLLALEQGSTRVRLPSHAVLAELLGTTRETVARALLSLVAAQDVVRPDRWHCDVSEAFARRPHGVDALATNTL